MPTTPDGSAARSEYEGNWTPRRCVVVHESGLQCEVALIPDTFAHAGAHVGRFNPPGPIKRIEWPWRLPDDREANERAYA
jgi:hypothetical protein